MIVPRPQVKVGGVYRSGSVTIEIDEIDVVPFSSITDEDLARTGDPTSEINAELHQAIVTAVRRL